MLFVVSILSDSDVLFEDASVVELSCLCFGLLNADGLKDESIEGIDDRALSFCMTLNRFEILNSYESYVKLSTFWVLHLQHIHDTSDRWSKFILASVISRQLEWYQILHSSQHIAL